MAEQKPNVWDDVNWVTPEEEPAVEQPSGINLEGVTFGGQPAPITFSQDNLETSVADPSTWDYIRMIPALAPAWLRAPGRFQEGIEKLFGADDEAKVKAEARAEKIQDFARATLGSMAAAVPTDRGKRFAEDYITEITRFAGSPFELYGTLLEDVGLKNEWDDFGRAVSDMGANPLDVYRRKGVDFGEEDFGDKLNQGIASTLGFVAAGAKAKAMNLSKKAIAGVVATLGAAVGSQSGRQEAEAFDATPEQIKAAFYFNGLFGLTEAVPVMKAFDRLDKALGGLLSKKIQSSVAKVGIAGIKGALEEALQEGFQSIGQDVVALESYDPTRSWNQNLKDSVEVGGSVGFLMSTLAAGLGVRTRRGKERTLKKSLGEEALRITGEATDVRPQHTLEDIAFNEEGRVQITTLSDAYLREQKLLADLNDLVAERARLLGDMEGVPEEAERRAEAGAHIPRVDQERLHSARERISADKQLFGGGYIADPEVMRDVHTNQPTKVKQTDGSMVDSVKLGDAVRSGKKVIMATTFDLEHDISIRQNYQHYLEQHKLRLQELEKIPAAERTRETLREMQQAREQIETTKKKLSILQARITEMTNVSRAIERIGNKVQKLFPKGTQLLFHDYSSLTSLDGRDIMDGAGGMAKILSFPRYDAQGGEINVPTIYLHMEHLSNYAAKIKEALIASGGIETEQVAALKEKREQHIAYMYDSIFHELGHQLAFQHWAGLHEKVLNGTATKQELTWWRALQADYVRFVNEGLRSPIRKAIMKIHPRPRAQSELAQIIGVPWTRMPMDLDTSWATDRINEILDTRAYGDQLSAEDIDYVFSFDEYMAEEMAKAATMGKIPGIERSKADPYFKKVVDEIRKLKAEQPGVGNLTSDTIGAYLMSLSVRGRMAQAVKAMQDKGADTINPLKAMMGKDELMSPETAIERLNEIDVFNKFMDIGFNLLQIADQNPHIKGLQEYVEYMRGWKNEVNSKLAVAQETITDWEKLGKKEQELVGRILLDETVGLTFDGKTLKKPRNFTPEEVAKYGLSEEALAVRAKVKADLRSALDEMERVLKAKVSSMFVNDPLKQAAELKKISSEFTELRNRPYFPLMRFGEWTLIVRAKQPMTEGGVSFKEGEIVDYQAFDTKRERDAAARKARIGGKPVTVAESYMKQPNFSIQGMPLTMVEHLERTLGNTLSEDQKRMFDQVKKDVLPFKSFRKQYTRRRKVRGYSMDAIRGYANYMTSFANHIGRVKFDSKFQQALKNVDDSISVMNRLGKDSTKRVQIYNYMNDHLEYVLNPVNEFTAIRSAAFFWFLGFNVKSAFVNATQIPLVTYPYLGAKHGDARAVAELTKANGTAIKSLTEIGTIDPELAQMIERGLAESWLDESLATELAMAASEKNLDKSLPRHWRQRTWQNVSHYGSLPFHTVEKLNRHVAAIAAYRLSRADGASHEQAILDARKCVEKTQFEYARWARPRFMRGKVGGTVFVFMNYLQNALYFALGGDPGAFRMWLMLFALAGLQGLPFAEDIMDLVDGSMTFAKKKLGMKDPWTDVRTDLRKTFKEMGADPDLILHGLSSSTFGLANIGEMMGWPIPDMDLSASLSLGRILPGAQILSPKQRDYDRFVSEFTQGIGGAAVSGGMDAIKAVFDNNPDQWKRWEKAFPSAMRQVSKAARIKVRGEEATRAGFEIASLDWQDHVERTELILQGLGFTPREVSQGWEGYIAAQSAITYYETWKASLLRDWNYFKYVGDDEGVKQQNAMIREYNRMVPDPALKIGPDAREQSFMSYARTHKLNERRIEQSAKSRRYSSSILEVYEDAEDNQ